MESIELECLTNLVQSMPVKKLAMEVCDGPRGQVYLAYGEAAGVVHGAWGYYGMC